MKKSDSGYTILLAILIVGFLLLLTTGAFRLVLNELQDNRGRGDYLKAQYAAEAGIELALLKVKDFGYGVVDEVPLDVNNRSIVLSSSPTDKNKYKGNQDALVSFLIDTKALAYTGEIASGEHSIIPLFYVDKDGQQHNATQISLSSSSLPPVWNIVGDTYGLAGEGAFTPTSLGNYKSVGENGFHFDKRSIQDFLKNSSSNYLILFNPDPNSSLSYTISGIGDSFFSRPVGEIFASGKIGSYKQNVRVTLDNTAYLNILKYSLFSN